MLRILLVFALALVIVPSAALACSIAPGSPSPTVVLQVSAAQIAEEPAGPVSRPGTYYMSMQPGCGPWLWHQAQQARAVGPLYHASGGLLAVGFLGSPLLFVLLFLFRKRRPSWWAEHRADPIPIFVTCVAFAMLLPRLERPGVNFCPPDLLNPIGILLVALTLLSALFVRRKLRERRPSVGALVAAFIIVVGMAAAGTIGVTEVECHRGGTDIVF